MSCNCCGCGRCGRFRNPYGQPYYEPDYHWHTPLRHREIDTPIKTEADKIEELKKLMKKIEEQKDES